jgi:recombination protein RecR
LSESITIGFWDAVFRAIIRCDFYPIIQSALPPSVEQLIEALRLLPGVGQKSATRLAFFLLRNNGNARERLGNAVLDATKNLVKCSVCGHFADEEVCAICTDNTRNQHELCVVEDSLDLLAIEKTNIYRGKYHVLGGALAPLEGVGPNDLRIEELVSRLQKGGITEIILATNPTLEGEATATLVVRKCSEFPDIKITRLARGIPVGGDVEYADEVTLSRAFENRGKF